MSYENVAHRMDDSQFVEQRRLACQEICRVFRVPSHMLNAGSGGDSLTYSTVEQQSLDFVRYSLTPWLRRIEVAISNDRDLAFQQQFARFEIDALLRPDSAGRAAFYTAALDPITGVDGPQRGTPARGFAARGAIPRSLPRDGGPADGGGADERRNHE